MDPLEAAFLFCFVFGLAMSGISFLLGTIHLPGLGHHGGGHEIGGHGHADVHGGHSHGGHGTGGDQAGTDHPEGQARAARGTPSPINVNTATAFLAFFGGIGYVLYGTLGLNAAVALLGAALAGLAGGGAVYVFLAKVLLASERVLDPADYRMEGTVARVTRSIRSDGIGEIIYTRDGTRRSEGARSATGQAIAANTEVVVVRYDKGIAYVEPWASYAGDGEV